MNFNVTGVTSAQSVFPTQIQVNHAKKDFVGNSENVDEMYIISESAKDFQVAKGVIPSIPDVRQDVVDDLLKRINTGSYNVSSSEVADKMSRMAFG